VVSILFYSVGIKLTTFKIIPASYQNEAKRIVIPGVATNIIPGSPEDIRIPVPLSGFISPLSGIGTPAITSGLGTPAEPVTALSQESISLPNGKVDSVDGEKPKPARKPENPLSRD
jgi:6-phosphofructo-2-kinase/fructose-2,6-biphosphatase 4